MKKQELSWKAGGQQGEGLESLGEIFAAALCSLGYECMVTVSFRPGSRAATPAISCVSPTIR